MNIGEWILIVFVANPIIGMIVTALLDTKDEVFYKWYSSKWYNGYLMLGELTSYLILFFWPVLAMGMIRYRFKRYQYYKGVAGK